MGQQTPIPWSPCPHAPVFSVACALVFGLIHPVVRHAVNVWNGGEWGRIHVAEQREKKTASGSRYAAG